ncbi:hypothetical protein ACFQ2T_05835 [Methylophilus flavus]|uniref:Apea-like HEPN domain-containing protein n=1 Tax=Methylophilus flavus TaxID=640084 RepID=A0ABW3P7B5_9PROT
MKLYSIRLNNIIRWNIDTSDPVSWTFSTVQGGYILNPLAAVDSIEIPTTFELGNDQFHVITNYLLLALEKEMSMRELGPMVDSWLRIARISSKQPALPLSSIAVSVADLEFENVKLRATPVGGFRKGILFGEHNVKTAMNAAAMQLMANLTNLDAVPLFHELILDAINAHMNYRYRDAILYSAFAVESLVQHELTRHYEEALAAHVPPGHLNIMTTAIGGGRTSKKDPIYALLTDGDNFPRLLHEAPLYLIRRSMLIEAPLLYKNARMLYATRNRLSHGQTIDSTDHTRLQINSDGSGSAVQIALEVFAWFDIQGYHFPDVRKVNLNSN